MILRLLFEGVHGKACSELINLKKEDVDKNRRILQLKDEDGSIRELEVSPICIETIEGAIKEKIYYKKNGDMDTDLDNVREYSDLVQNDCVIRNCIGNTDYYEFVKKHTIYSRITIIEEYLHKHEPELIDILTAKSITRSGMIYEGKKLYGRNGTLTKKDYEWIKLIFNVKNPRLLREIVTEEMIKKMYNLG